MENKCLLKLIILLITIILKLQKIILNVKTMKSFVFLTGTNPTREIPSEPNKSFLAARALL